MGGRRTGQGKGCRSVGWVFKGERNTGDGASRRKGQMVDDGKEWVSFVTRLDGGLVSTPATGRRPMEAQGTTGSVVQL
jgi:hypothetical protein